MFCVLHFFGYNQPNVIVSRALFSYSVQFCFVLCMCCTELANLLLHLFFNKYLIKLINFDLFWRYRMTSNVLTCLFACISNRAKREQLVIIKIICVSCANGKIQKRYIIIISICKPKFNIVTHSISDDY